MPLDARNSSKKSTIPRTQVRSNASRVTTLSFVCVVSIVLDAYPGEFDRVPTNGAIVRRKISKLFPHEPSTYAAPPTDVPLKATLSPKLTKELSPEHPHHLLIRGEPGEISLDVGTRLFEAYKRLIACPGLSWPAEKGKNRSSSSAFHLGVWGIVSKAPFITHDTRQADPDARALMNDFLAIIRDEVAPLIARIIQFHLPNVWVTQQRCVPLSDTLLTQLTSLRPGPTRMSRPIMLSYAISLASGNTWTLAVHSSRSQRALGPAVVLT